MSPIEDSGHHAALDRAAQINPGLSLSLMKNGSRQSEKRGGAPRGYEASRVSVLSPSPFIDHHVEDRGLRARLEFRGCIHQLCCQQVLSADAVEEWVGGIVRVAVEVH